MASVFGGAFRSRSLRCARLLVVGVIMLAASGGGQIRAEPPSPPSGGDWNAACHSENPNATSVNECCLVKSQDCRSKCGIDTTCVTQCFSAQSDCVSLNKVNKGGTGKPVAKPIQKGKPVER